MALGDDIGGFKYINPGAIKSEDKQVVLDEDMVFKRDYVGSRLNNKLTRLVTGLTSFNSSGLFQDISNLLEKAFEAEGVSSYSGPEKYVALRTKLEELYLEDRDLGKSIDRGCSDIASGKIPKTTFLKKVKSELIEPIEAHINTDESIFSSKKEELLRARVNVRLSFNNQFASKFIGRG